GGERDVRPPRASRARGAGRALARRGPAPLPRGARRDRVKPAATSSRAGGYRARMATSDALTAEVTDLLQLLIRNQCVNDGTMRSGEETRSVDLLQQYLGSTGLDTELYEP